MYAILLPWITLSRQLLEYEGGDTYADVLGPWLAENEQERRWLAQLGRWDADATDLCRLYAASSATSALLLEFQDGDKGFYGPPITAEVYRRFHEAMGFRVPKVETFHPFYHEIVGVRQAYDPDAPVEIVEERWPPVMLGEMMFCRGGCVVSAGASHVVKEIAEASTLFWARLRRDRPYEDPSGWGGNSGWRTLLRRDYATPVGFSYNVDGTESLDGRAGTVEGIPVAAMVEIVRHRCLVRARVDDWGLHPYAYSYSEPAEAWGGRLEGAGPTPSSIYHPYP